MSGTLRICADENMPGLWPFASLGMVTPRVGRSLRASDLVATDVLLVRSVTRVDRALLEGTPVRFVGSATIGTDHVDRDWLAGNGIGFAHAPGCNAMAVVEYVLQALLGWCERDGREPWTLSLGIVGVGNVGSRLAAAATALGIRVVVSDPPRLARGDRLAWRCASLEEVLDADVVTLHVPLTTRGTDATHHLLGAPALARLGPEQLLINTSRGPVVDNQALSERLMRTDAPACVLDVWENEPRVPRALMERVWLGTPHVAGYSHEGKLRGSWMLYRALGEYLGRPRTVPPLPLVGHRRWAVRNWRDVLALLRAEWRLEDDHRRLADSLDAADPARAFDALRRDYPLRHELAARQWEITASDALVELRILLTAGRISVD